MTQCTRKKCKKTTRKKSMKSLSNWYKCIKKVASKQITKKDFSKVKQIQNKMKYNASLQAPRIIINMNNTILKRKDILPSNTVKIAKQMIQKAKKDIKKNKTKKFKKITREEMVLIRKYQKQLKNEVKKQC